MSAGRPTFYRTQLAKNSPTVVGTKGTELPVNLRVCGIFPVPSASMELAQEIDHVPSCVTVAVLYGCVFYNCTNKVPNS